MLHRFFDVDLKLILTWATSGSIVMLNKVGLPVDTYEEWVVVIIDLLTVISLAVAIGYTITRWRRLLRERKIPK